MEGSLGPKSYRAGLADDGDALGGGVANLDEVDTGGVDGEFHGGGSSLAGQDTAIDVVEVDVAFGATNHDAVVDGDDFNLGLFGILDTDGDGLEDGVVGHIGGDGEGVEGVGAHSVEAGQPTDARQPGDEAVAFVGLGGKGCGIAGGIVATAADEAHGIVVGKTGNEEEFLLDGGLGEDGDERDAGGNGEGVGSLGAHSVVADHPGDELVALVGGSGRCCGCSR